MRMNYVRATRVAATPRGMLSRSMVVLKISSFTGSGGAVITSLDPDLQRIAVAAVSDGLRELENERSDTMLLTYLAAVAKTAQALEAGGQDERAIAEYRRVDALRGTPRGPDLPG